MKTIKVKSWGEIPEGYTGIVEYSTNDKVWYLNGKKHREDGPAVVLNDGTKEWYLNGKYHRIDGPAIVGVNRDKFWCLHGKLHRIDGPAMEYISGHKEYYINGKLVSKEAQEVLYAMCKLKGLL